MPRLLQVLEKDAPRMSVVSLPVQFRTVAAGLAGGLDAAVTVADELPANIRREPLFADGFTCLYDARHARLGTSPRRSTSRDRTSSSRTTAISGASSRTFPQDPHRPVFGVELRARRRAHRRDRDARDGSANRRQSDSLGEAPPEDEAASLHHPGVEPGPTVAGGDGRRRAVPVLAREIIEIARKAAGGSRVP